MLLHNLARRARPLAARRLLHATAPVSDTAEGATTIHNTSEFLNERELGFMANELVSRRSHGARRWQASDTETEAMRDNGTRTRDTDERHGRENTS